MSFLHSPRSINLIHFEVPVFLSSAQLLFKLWEQEGIIPAMVTFLMALPSLL